MHNQLEWWRDSTALSNLCFKTNGGKTSSWDKLLPAVLFAYREIPKTSTRYPPFTLAYSLFLLPGSSTGTYRGTFQLFHSIYHQTTGLTLDGKSLHLDFEKAAHTAAKAVIPGITLKGCLLHLKQSWWRCIQREGLGEEFKTPDSEIGQFLKTKFGLPFLDDLDVCESFNN
ncbi:hypothetical protein ElyMa_004498000 [Elysia marginata]|uniref:MULE transposase domain-containing protein n=1 Tax=Elysia marginata TaxID=1093978 RepID=A0AAV4HKW0_9GAST|nr:hypothetical protein ElyMa_004498000 [Elysia marginata]